MQMVWKKEKKVFPALFFFSFFINSKKLIIVSFNKFQIRNTYQKNKKKKVHDNVYVEASNKIN